MVLSLLSAAWCGAFLFVQTAWLPVVGIAVCLTLGLLFWLAKRFWLPHLVQISADRYAEKAWTIFIEIRGRAKTTEPGKG